MLRYFGDIAEVEEALQGKSRRLKQAYRDILGNKGLQRFRGAIERLITPASFVSLQRVQRGAGAKAVSRANKFIVTYPEEDHPVFSIDGSFQAPSTIKTSPGFALHREGFENAAANYEPYGISPYFGSLLHEYNHFLIYLLQERPFFFCVLMTVKFLGLPMWPLDTKNIISYIHQKHHREPREQVIQLIQLGIMLGGLDQTMELCVRALDFEILKRLDYDVEGYFSSEPKHIELAESDQPRAVFTVPIGDPFYGFSIEERLQTVTTWETSFKPSNQSQQNFTDSVKRTRFSKEPLPALDE